MSTSRATAETGRASARDRLLAAANELFYEEGVQSVGIDRVIERAGVAKASLYNHFAGKEDLVAAYLAGRHERQTARLAAAAAGTDDPRGRILAVFEAQARQFDQPGYKGCPFAAASTEAPAGGLVEQATREFRSWVRRLFVELSERAGAEDPAVLASQLHLLYDGAALGMRLDRDPSIAGAVRDGVDALLDRALPPGDAPTAHP